MLFLFLSKSLLEIKKHFNCKILFYSTSKIPQLIFKFNFFIYRC